MFGVIGVMNVIAIAPLLVWRMAQPPPPSHSSSTVHGDDGNRTLPPRFDDDDNACRCTTREVEPPTPHRHCPPSHHRHCLPREPNSPHKYSTNRRTFSLSCALEILLIRFRVFGDSIGIRMSGDGDGGGGVSTSMSSACGGGAIGAGTIAPRRIVEANDERRR